MVLMILVFFAFLAVSSFVPSKGFECPNCSGQYIKRVDHSTGKCVDCWPCPECLDGGGSSVPCNTTVPLSTKIHCVQCVDGANFSDSYGTDQCQPCGLCAGEHEYVLKKCMRESDVKCDCKAGFYRNKTNDKCIPCSSCPSCMQDEDIISKCQKYGGEQQMTTSSTTTYMYSTSLVSTLGTSSHSHYASMSLLPGLTITKYPVPTRTQQISATSTSISNHQKNETTPTSIATVQVDAINPDGNIKKIKDGHTHESSSKKTIIVLSIVCVCLLLICVCLLYHKLKNCRKRKLNDYPVRFAELNQDVIEEGEQGNDEESNSCETSGNRGSEPNLSSSLNGSEDDFDKTADSDHQDGRVIATGHPEHTAAIEAQKGIPSSLEDEQRNFISQGHDQPVCDLPEDAQDGSVFASKDGTVVPSNNLDPLDMKNKMPSGNNTAVNVFVNFHDLTQIQRGTGAVPPLADFTSTSCGNNWVIPASSSGMPVPLNQGTVCGLSSITAPAAQPTEGNRGYATHITCVPLPVIKEMCRLLDLDRDVIDGNDYTRLGSELGLDSIQIQTLKQKCNNPSYVILMQVFSAKTNSGTLKHLIPLLTKMGRHDVIQVIDRWVDNQKCTQAAMVN